MIFAHQIESVFDRGVRLDRDRIDDDAAFALFYAANHLGLGVLVHIFMDNADAAEARHHYRGAVLGDRIHRSTHERGI